MGVRGWNAVGVFGAPPYISSQIFVKEPTPITKDRESVFSQFLFWRDLWSNPPLIYFCWLLVIFRAKMKELKSISLLGLLHLEKISASLLSYHLVLDILQWQKWFVYWLHYISPLSITIGRSLLFSIDSCLHLGKGKDSMFSFFNEAYVI